MNKAFGNTLWFVYGKEPERVSKTIEKSWFRSIFPPYLAGHGIGVRLGDHVVRVGVCTPLYRPVIMDDESAVTLYTTFGSELKQEPQEIGKWVYSEEEQLQPQD